jgi:4-methyl-5(b-hydroxyethyl)-thiazole monophosphate biosynthesis
MEAVTVIDVLRRAGFEVVAAGVDGTNPIRGSNGVVLVPDAGLAEVIDEPWDLLAIPGGIPNTERLRTEEPLLALIRERFAAGQWVAAICAAPRVLDAAGIADKIELTSHPVVADTLRHAKAYREEAVVADGKVVTSRGAGTALPWALDLVERLAGTERRHAVEAMLALR